MRLDDLQVAFDEVHRQVVRPGERCGHRQYLHIAWVLMRRLGLEQGAEAAVAGMRGLSGIHGETARHQMSITRFWTRLIAHVQQMRPDLEDFEAVLRAFPLLLDPSLFRRHQRESEPTNPAWGAPDLGTIPRV